MMIDGELPAYKFYRNHQIDVPVGFKAGQQGYNAIDQDSETANYSRESEGDESSWIFWGKNTRVLGTWAQIFLAKVQNSQGYILPVFSQSMAADDRFARKQVVTAAVTSDVTKCRTIAGELPAEGEFGLVLQATNEDGYEQIFVPVATSSNVIYARIVWNYTPANGDMSEGEILTWNRTLQAFEASGTLVWIDFQRSLNCSFDTAGADTIFEVRYFQPRVLRDAIERPLCVAVRCFEDRGHRITHLRKRGKTLDDNRIFGAFLSTDLAAPPWTWSDASIIYTPILEDVRENVVLIRLPEEWDTLGIENYDYLERFPASYSAPWDFRPIRPVLDDNDGEVYRSAETYDGNLSIASYRRG